jgi:spermidine synthase
VKKNIKNILIIGGGDLGIALRLLNIQKDISVTLVEIDKMVTDVALKYVYPNQKNILLDPRLQIVYEDAVEYISRNDQKYDLIIVDSTDDCGVGSVLYQDLFVKNLKKRLQDKGVLMRLSGSFFLQKEAFKKIKLQSERLFGKKSVGTIYLPLHMYQGGVYTVTICFKNNQFTHTPHSSFVAPGEWYNKERHTAISVLF